MILKKRPEKFSDPNMEYSQEECHDILVKEDSSLGVSDFLMIFSENLPIGNYEECAYFIPILVRFVMNEEGWLDGLPDVIENFFAWARHNTNYLIKDDIFDYIVLSFQDLLRRDISVFTLRESSYGCCSPTSAYRVIEIISGLNKLIASEQLADTILKAKLSFVLEWTSACWALYLIYSFVRDSSSPFPICSEFLAEISKNDEYVSRCKLIMQRHAVMAFTQNEVSLFEKCKWLNVAVDQ